MGDMLFQGKATFSVAKGFEVLFQMSLARSDLNLASLLRLALSRCGGQGDATFDQIVGDVFQPKAA